MGLNLLRRWQPTNPDQPLGGRYKIVSNLGEGGFGQTFLAEDLHLPDHPQCVVKQLKPQVKNAESLVMARRLFDTEARVLYQLGNHDQIPRLMAHFEDDQEFYLAQEYIEGEPLTQELVKSQPWSEHHVIALLHDILHVLTFVHNQNVIHRDIKPSNLIRRRSDGKVVLIDFGAVKQVSTQTTNSPAGQTKTISIGTQGYTPKEQLGGNPRFSSDVYAVGMIGLQALTGVHPKRLPEDPQTGEVNWHDLAPQVSPELAEILDTMVRYDFRTRYASAQEALEVIQGLPLASGLLSEASELDLDSTQFWQPDEPAIQPLSGTAPTLTTSEPTQTSQKRSIKPWLILAGLGVVGGIVAIATPLLLPQPQPQLPRQIADRTPVLTASPTAPSTTEPTSSSLSPSPSPSLTESPSTRRTEKPTPSTPATPIVVTPSTRPPEKPTPVVSVTPTPASQASAKPRPSTPPPTPTKPEPSGVELQRQADRLREAGQYQQALSLYDQAIARQPDQAPAHWGRCYSLNSLQQPADAISACNQALALNPNYPEALWSKGNALDQQQRPADALKLYEQATALKPDFAEAWNNQGVALLMVGRASEAIAALNKATALRSNFADAWANLGAAFWEVQDFDQAIAAMDKALQIEPNNPNAINLRQQAREKLGR